MRIVILMMPILLLLVTITVSNPGNDDNVYNRKVSFKNYALFSNCTLRINSQLIEDAQDLDTVIPMYNLLHYGLFGIIIQICQNLDMIIMQI